MKKKLFREGGDGGFTLIELMVVMAIIAVLAVLIISAINAARSAAADTTRRSNGKSLQVALEAYYAAQKSYPASATGTDGLSSITDLGSPKLSTYLSPTLSDPAGTDGNVRYCYATSNSGYRLRVMMGSSNTAPVCVSATGAYTGESFDVNP